MTEDQRKKQIAEARRGVAMLSKRKAFAGKVKLASEAKEAVVARVPTGSFTLDVITGGGFPRNRITEIHGVESSGKTTMVLKAIAECQRQGLMCAYLESEGNWDSVYAANLGVDLARLVLSEEESEQETLIDMTEVMISSGIYDLVVYDSLPAPTPKAVLGRSASEPTMGVEARLNNLLMRKAIAGMRSAKKQCAFVFINQLRANMGWGDAPPQPPGGYGVRYLKSLAIEARRAETRGPKGEVVKGKAGVAVGQTIALFTPKNKTYRPRLQGSVDYYYSAAPEITVGAYQYDLVKEVVTMATGTPGVLRRGGSWYYLDIEGLPEKANGMEEIVKVVREYPEAHEVLKGRIIEALR